MKKIFLTSALAMCFALPAFAEGEIANAEGLLSNKGCDQSTLGVTEGTANIEAIWSPNQYSAVAGQYVRYIASNGSQECPNGDDSCVLTGQQCPAGSYCEGFSNETFAETDMGINSCSTQTNGDYPSSDAGTASSSYCYAANNAISCATVNPVTVAAGHGTVTYTNQTTSGRDYANGQEILTTTTACAATVTCAAGYQASGTNTKGALADYVAPSVLWHENNVRFKSKDGQNTMGANAASMGAGDWEITYADGTKISGTSECSVTTATNSGDTLATIDTTTQDGYQCWCKMGSYQFSGQSAVTTASSSWVFEDDYGTAALCASDCADRCANYVASESAFRGALFGSLGAYPTCGANTIGLNWYDNTVEKNGALIQNVGSAATCTYGDTANDANPLTLPTAPADITGYTFGGWRLRPAANNNGND